MLTRRLHPGLSRGRRPAPCSCNICQNWQRAQCFKQHKLDRHRVSTNLKNCNAFLLPKSVTKASNIKIARYFLTLTSFQPLYGKLSDIFGRKACLLFAYAVFGIGCLGCGLAQSMTQLCVARAVAGIGGGGMSSVVSILLSDIVPLQERGVWQGYINVVYAAGTSTGGPLGGLFADSLGWRW